MPSEPRSSEVPTALGGLRRRLPTPPIPAWVPGVGHLSHRTGIYFDVIRIFGDRGIEVADELIATMDGNAGPIISPTSGRNAVLFVLPLDTVDQRSWPPGVFAHGKRWHEYVAIPALEVSTGPARWESHPTVERQYVDPEALFELVCRLTHWPGGPP
ncbi:hypothetical protein [Streptomyces sp. NPDC058989]|uniref:hypothetical protein n=1 Tax=Streptomyces sp. NPDC058989 TaxID=3346686 RepID=UPI0036AB54A0